MSTAVADALRADQEREIPKCARVLGLTPTVPYFVETKCFVHFWLIIYVVTVTSLNSQRLGAGEILGLRRCRPVGPLRDLCLYSFPSLNSIQIRALHFLVVCRPSFHHLLFGSKLWLHTVVHCCYTLPFAFCCMFCINILSFSLYDSSQILKTVFFQSSIVLCILFRGITSSFRRSTSKMEGWSF